MDWRLIQQKTFTRWCNQQLKVQKISIEDLSTAFCDGVNLIALMEVLSLKSVGRHNRKPKVHAQKVDNVSKALDFIMREERIKLVNIGSEDIVTPNLKLILGLVWTLILHYQISQGFGFDIDDPATEAVEGPSAAQALLAYVKKMLPNKTINNLTTDWNDGILIASLVDAHAPGLCTEMDTMDHENALENATLAMKLAEEWLDVPQLLEPQDMVNSKVDELSMMTYLSQFLDAKLKPGAPLKQRIDPSQIMQCTGTVTSNGFLLSECTFHKPGILGCNPEEVRVREPVLGGCHVGESLNIVVDLVDAGAGNLCITIDGPHILGATGTFDDQDGAVSLNLVFHKAGTYKMAVRYGDQEVKGSPYHIRAWDPSLVTAYGSGITGIGTSVGLPADVFVDLSKSGVGSLEVAVMGPSGETYAIDVSLTERPDVFIGSYVPVASGEYRISIKLERWEVANNPFTALICDLSKVILDGPGLVKAIVNCPNFIEVFAEDGIYGELAAQFKSLLGPQDVEYHCTRANDGHHQICYTPHQVGMMEITVTCNGLAIQHSCVTPCIDPTTVTVRGAGISPEILAGKPAEFFIDASHSGPGDVEALITDPSGGFIQTQIACTQQGTYAVTYEPTLAGEHAIALTFGGLKVEGSPYMVHVCDPGVAKVSGPGLKVAYIGVENLVEMCTEGSGMNKVDVNFESPLDTFAADYRLLELNECNKQIYYTPHNVGMFDMIVNCFHETTLITSQSFAVLCIDPTLITLDWRGMDANVPFNEERQILINTDDSGAQNVDVCITDLKGKVVGYPRVTEHIPGKHTVTIKIDRTGQYQLDIKCNNTSVFGCGHTFTAFDPKAIKVFGPGLDQAIMNQDNVIEVDTEEAKGSGEVGVIFSFTDQALCQVNYEIKLVSENHYKINYFPQQVGIYRITVTYAGTAIGPNTVTVPCIDPSSVTINGRGPQTGILVGSPVDFTIDASNAGPGTVDVAMTNAKGEKVPVDMEQTDCGVYNITYIPFYSGDYRAGITFGGQEVQGSPFVTQVCNPNSVVAFGAGLDKSIALNANSFTVDASQAGDGALNLTIEGPEECNIDCKADGDHIYCVSYVPPLAGTYSVNIKFADVHIPGSPFLVACSRAPSDASKCHAVMEADNQAIMVDAKNAGGTGALEVGVWGAQVPARYVTVEHNGDYTFNVSYEIPEPGETEISIKWHGQHIMGSPFKVVTE
eukprot:Em0006g1376a